MIDRRAGMKWALTALVLSFSSPEDLSNIQIC